MTETRATAGVAEGSAEVLGRLVDGGVLKRLGVLEARWRGLAGRPAGWSLSFVEHGALLEGRELRSELMATPEPATDGPPQWFREQVAEEAANIAEAAGASPLSRGLVGDGSADYLASPEKGAFDRAIRAAAQSTDGVNWSGPATPIIWPKAAVDMVDRLDAEVTRLRDALAAERVTVGQLRSEHHLALQGMAQQRHRADLLSAEVVKIRAEMRKLRDEAPVAVGEAHELEYQGHRWVAREFHEGLVSMLRRDLAGAEESRDRLHNVVQEERKRREHLEAQLVDERRERHDIYTERDSLRRVLAEVEVERDALAARRRSALVVLNGGLL